MEIIFSFYKGFLLSGAVYVFGKWLDEYISNSSKEVLVKENEKLVEQGERAVQINLLCVSPLIYTLVDQTMLKHTWSFSWVDFSGLLLIQNIGYFVTHREMHRNTNLYWMHSFHHQYDKLLIPSIANAVSVYEFCLAYVSPIVIGGWLLKPSGITFMASIGTISFLNLMIHTQELTDTQWLSWMVSPAKHLKHHEAKTKNYAAPILDIDAFMVTAESWVQTDSEKKSKIEFIE